MIRAIRLAPVLGLALLACRPEQTQPPVETPPTDAAATKSAAEIIAASDLPPLLSTPLPGDEMAVTVHRLQNGMTVYISTDRQKPRFTAWLTVRSGSRNDPADSTGLAHYLEHMLFKGTDDYGTLDYEAERPHLDRIAALYDELRQADDAQRERIFAEIDQETQATAAYAVPNELDRLYSGLGIEGVNAFTSDEITAYIGDIPSNRLEAWARIEAERFADPVFRLFYPELEAVYEEKNLTLDDPDDRMSETMMLALFPEHPYGTQPTIGVTEHLKSPAYGDMVQYFQDWYAPNNMAVVLAGDIDPETALPVLEATLGQLPPREIGTPDPGKITPVAGRVAREVVAEGEQTVMMAWQTVAVRHEDEPALEVLDWLMDNSRSGLLNLELELTQQVQDAGSWTSHFNEAGYFAVKATLQQGQEHQQVEQMLLAVIAKLRAGEITQAEIDAIKLHEDMGDKRALESTWARVSRMAESFVQHQPWDEVVGRRERLRAVTREDVIRVANTYLGQNYVVVYRRDGKPTLPNIDKPTITPIDIDSSRQSPFAAEIQAMAATPLEPEWLVEGKHYGHAKLPAGPLIAAANPRNDLFSLQYRFDRGRRDAKMLCVGFELLERSGAGALSAEELQRELYALGTDIRFYCDDDSSEIGLSGIDGNLERSVALLDQWLRTASFDDQTLSKLSTNILSERRDNLDDPDRLARMLDDYARYGDRSSWLSEPSNAAVAKLDGKQLRKLLAAVPDHQHRTLYFGPRSAEQAAAAVALGKKHKKVGPPPKRRFRKGKDVTIYFLHKDVAKSAVGVTLPQGPQPRTNEPVARYYGQYLGGDMSSLIFQEIREARGLAYYAYGFVSTGWQPGDDWGLLGGMGTQADKTVDALTVYLELLRTHPIEAERLTHARSSLDVDFRSSRIDPRWIVWLVDGWDQMGDPGDPRPAQWQQIQGLQLTDVQEFAGELGKAPVILSIVGDRARVDLEALGKLGKVVEVEAKDLTSYGAF